jgi:hypothetical protein
VTMYRFAAGGPMDVEEVRDRIRRMTDEQLFSYGKAAAYMRTPKANLGNPPREAFLIQLHEAHAEWRRRESVDATGGRHSRNA